MKNIFITVKAVIKTFFSCKSFIKILLTSKYKHAFAVFNVTLNILARENLLLEYCSICSKILNNKRIINFFINLYLPQQIKIIMQKHVLAQSDKKKNKKIKKSLSQEKKRLTQEKSLSKEQLMKHKQKLRIFQRKSAPI